MTKYEFQGGLYRNSHDMHSAIAREWISAGGSNNDADIARFLTEATDEQLANEAIGGWGLTETNDEGEPVMPDFDRAELVEAFRNFRKEFAKVEESVAKQILHIRNTADDAAGLVKQWANCAEAEIDDDGDIWISGPQIGHWLNDERKAEFAAWCKAR